MKLRVALAALAVVLLTAPVRATTTDDLQSRASTLSAAYSDLSAQIDSCPGGACLDRAAILAREASLDASLAAFRADWVAAGGLTTDATLANVQTQEVICASKTGSWEEES